MGHRPKNENIKPPEEIIDVCGFGLGRDFYVTYTQNHNP